MSWDGALTPPFNALEDIPRTVYGRVVQTADNVRQFVRDEAEYRASTIGGIDNMWLILSDLTDFAPTCLSTYTLKDPVSKDALVRLIGMQADKFPRYKERLTDRRRRWHGARFELDPNFKVENHIRTVKLPGNAGEHELHTAVSRFLSEEWDLRRPLWDCLLVENYRDDSGATCALITRGHHTLADGQGFVLSQLYITSYQHELEKMMDGSAQKLDAASKGKLKPSQISKQLRPFDKLMENPFGAVLVQLFVFNIFWSSQLLSFLEGLIWSLRHLVHSAILYTWVSWRTEYVTAGYRGRRVPGKDFAASQTFSIQDVKTIQKAFSGLEPGHWATKLSGGKSKLADKTWHVTLNDVVCAIMADVLAEEVVEVKPAQGLWPQFKYHFNRSFRPPISFFIPISVRSPGQWDMRNLSVGANVWLKPMNTSNDTPSAKETYDHIHNTQSELNIIKKSLLPQGMFYGLQMSASQTPILWPFPFALVPGPVRTWLVEPFFVNIMSAFTAILTNVPGPAKSRVTLCGSEVVRWTALPPQGEKGTIGIGVISYAGTLAISCVADDVRESRGVSKRICDRFEERFKTYLDVAREVLGQTEANGYH